MKNLGKAFEQNFRKSLPLSNKLYYYRLKDTASSYYGGNEHLRFSQNNIADAFLFYVGQFASNLLILEFKNHKGKSLPLSCIRKNQLNDMLRASDNIGVIPMIIVFFSDMERCFSLDISYVEKFIDDSDRKSIPLDYFEHYGTEIEVEKLKTNYKYNIAKWLENF